MPQGPLDQKYFISNKQYPTRRLLRYMQNNI